MANEELPTMTLKRPDPKSVIWELQDKFYEEECTLLEALSQAFDFGKHASSTPEPAAVDRAALFGLADKWLKHAAAIRSDEGVTAAAEALEGCANELLALTEQAGKAQGWLSTEARPLESGETRVMAVQILRNGTPDWDVFVATVCDEEEDAWSSESNDPGWAPSEVGYSMSIEGLPALPTKDPTNG